jgi:glycosyltransferase involved in cell wall biosynthesis
MKTAKDMRVALLSNVLRSDHQLPTWDLLRQRVGQLKVFLSTDHFPGTEEFIPDWGRLDVTVQRCLMLSRPQRDERSFIGRDIVFIPTDTIRLLRRFRPDVIVTRELGIRTLQAAVYRAVFARHVPLVLWAGMSDYTEATRDAIRVALRRLVAGQFSALLLNGESGVRYFRTLMGRRMPPQFRAPYTPRLDPFLAVTPDDAAAMAARPMRWLFAGRIIKGKGLVRFLEPLIACARDNPGRRLEIRFVGDGPDIPRLQNLPWPDNLRPIFVGQIPHARIAELFRGVDWFFFPSLADEWGVAVQESMAAGVPVLGSRLSQAVEELVIDGETGWSFDPYRTDDIRMAIDKAWSAPPGTIAGMRRRAREKAMTLTPEWVVGNILLALETAVAERGRPSRFAPPPEPPSVAGR